MKFLERFALIVYSFIILLISVILSLLIFNWIDFDVVMEMLKALVTGDLSSKITLGVSIVFILLSIKCMFFDEKSKEYTLHLSGRPGVRYDFKLLTLSDVATVEGPEKLKSESPYSFYKIQFSEGQEPFVSEKVKFKIK